jgi:hypothetical protein
MFGRDTKLKQELIDTPGVNSYDIYGPQKPKGLGFSSVKLKSIFDKRTGTPGPNSYDLEVDVSKRCRGTRFVTSKQERTPFDKPRNTPGPNSYIIQLPGQPKRMRNLRSASMRSATRRDSEFSKMGVGPGIGRYVLQTVNKWSIPKNTNPKLHTFGPIKDRFADSNCFQGDMSVAAAIPGPGMYKLDHSFQRTRQLLPEQEGQKLYKLAGNGKRFLGKQNEMGVKPHTFGADKDRFKDSMYGRLDLIAQAPGVGEYDVARADFHTTGDIRADICVPVLPRRK